MRARAAGLRVERILAQFEEVPSLSGTVDSLIELDARGESVDALRAGLAGDVLVVVREGNAASTYARRLEANVLRAVVSRAPLVRGRPEDFEELARRVAAQHEEEQDPLTGVRIEIWRRRFEPASLEPDPVLLRQLEVPLGEK